MEIIGLLIILYVGYQLLQGKKLSDPVVPKKEPEYTYDDVIAAQLHFEDTVRKAYLPDSVNIFNTYIYFKLLKPWYENVEAKYRNDKEKLNFIRGDWINYLNLLQEIGTKKFLLSENSNREKAMAYLHDIRAMESEANTIEYSIAQLADESKGKVKLEKMQKEMEEVDIDKLEKKLSKKYGVEFTVFTHD